MRPALEVLAQQQKIADEQKATINAQATRIGQHEQVFVQQRDLILRQAAAINQLNRGLEFLAGGLNCTSQLRTAMRRTADEQNPAQPIPEPPAQPAPFSTEETKTPEAMADVQTPGMVGGSTKDVAADVTSTVYTPGQDVDASPLKNLVDVTAPVDGTQTPRPLSEVRTETDVRHGDPMNPQTAFPVRGDFANAQRLGSAANPIRETDTGPANRTMASLRLARLQIEAGTAEGDDFEVATRIEKSATSQTDIETQIRTLESVKTASRRRQPPQNLVPRTAAGSQRTVPSMATVASGGGSNGSTDQDVVDADLFD